MGRPVPIRAGVGASGPTGAGVCACGRTGGFPLAPRPLRIATRSNRAPLGTASPNSRRSRRVNPHQGESLTAKLSFSDAKQGAFRSPPAPLRIANRSNRAPNRAASPAPAPKSARQALPVCPNIKTRRRIIPPADWNSLGFLPAASVPSKNGKQSACGRLPPPR